MLSIITPYRSDDAERTRNWEWCHRRWQALLPTAGLVICDSGHEPFNRGASINLGVENWAGDVLVIADADVAVSSGDVAAAVEAAYSGQWVIAYAEDGYHTLTVEATERLLAADPAGRLPVPYDGPWTCLDRVESVSGVLAMPRGAFERAGGFDTRWDGWGGEDRAFAITLDMVWGPPARTPGPLLHLWHPRGLDFRSPGWPANAALLERYREWQLGTPGFGDPRHPTPAGSTPVA